MKKEEAKSGEPDKTLAAVCGLYCKACSWFIATTEEPERLTRLAAEMNYSKEEAKCHGCRSGKKLPYCGNCKMFACASDQGIDFCSECEDFPCDDLKRFQSAMPHRIEVLDNLARITSIGYKQWLGEIQGNYSCLQCQTINSTYDHKCRNCGEEPSCSYVANHRQEIDHYLERK